MKNSIRTHHVTVRTALRSLAGGALIACALGASATASAGTWTDQATTTTSPAPILVPVSNDGDCCGWGGDEK